ncbi:MAG: branched-chain amino acid ABC transporter permease [Burkholderiaceae bacterium]|jgi:branched-chain amino acid transport system permease protein|nr:branched-chain amino acid ABC transporter permease [Burkholderiaceae bacterium]HMN63687.1 branched-chain amino acid ABC transporter permease [Burkholderiaceae bacterium]
MTADIVLWLVQDGVTNGAIYALLALALLLVFAVTRVIFVPQGEFIAYAALSLGLLQTGQVPGTVYVLVGGGLLAAAFDIAVAVREKATGRLPRILLVYVAVPVAMAALAWWAAPRKLDMWAQVLIVIGLVVPLGPILYRVAYQPLANASVLVLFIISMAAHYALTGLGLVFFGGEGLRSAAFSDAKFRLGVLDITAQSVWVVSASVVGMIALWLFFERTLYGKALRATAINRVGARLVGIPTELSGSLSFLVAAFIGAVSGVLIAPITTIYYDTGLMIGLKGFVGAILGGMASYPLAAAGAVAVGLLESFSSFWASALKESIVFTLIIPVLVWRSLTSRHHVEDEEE